MAEPLFTLPKIPPIPPLPPEIATFQANALSKIPKDLPNVDVIAGCGQVNLQMKAINSMLAQTRKAVSTLTSTVQLQQTLNNAALLASGAENAGDAIAVLLANPVAALLTAGGPVLQGLIDHLPSLPENEFAQIMTGLESMLDIPALDTVNSLMSDAQKGLGAVKAITDLASCKSSSIKIS